ncbi:hypothetical protein ZWY2020_026351 [Hordeum vulgare]|nr:hypothetical protein ZWY2020_026351 [Hordeum vulgare]
MGGTALPRNPAAVAVAFPAPTPKDAQGATERHDATDTGASGGTCRHFLGKAAVAAHRRREDPTPPQQAQGAPGNATTQPAPAPKWRYFGRHFLSKGRRGAPGSRRPIASSPIAGEKPPAQDGNG